MALLSADIYNTLCFALVAPQREIYYLRDAWHNLGLGRSSALRTEDFNPLILTIMIIHVFRSSV